MFTRRQLAEVDPATVFAKENWLALCDLIGTDGTVHLSGLSDTENGDASFAGVHIDGDGTTKRATGGTVEMVVLALAGDVRMKVCRRCGENKPLDAYCKRGDLPDGREYRCKKCEARRVKDHAARKRAVAAAG